MENESNKTAIDQMFDIIEGLAEYSPENPMLQSLMKAKPRLKEVEKEQIKDAYGQGWIESENMNLGAEDYYSRTYGNK
jgi:hypothetical protein